MIAVGCVYQLRRHAKSVAGLADTALQDGAHVQCLRDFRDVLFLSPKCKRGRARGDLKPRNLGQCIDDLLRQAIAEILLFFVITHVGKRQNSNGWSELLFKSFALEPTAVVFFAYYSRNQIADKWCAGSP